MNTHARPVRVAAGQMVAHSIDHAADAWPAIDRLIARAVEAGADLLVLPECTYPAYFLGSRERLSAADILPTAAVLERLSARAAAARIHLCCGIAEQAANGRLFNSAVLIDPTGRLIGMARKTFLWDCDCRWFIPGEAIGVFDTAIGRIGIMICADARVPEIAATLATRKAQFVAMPTAWVNTSGDPTRLYNIQPDFLIEARAREFAMPFVCADKSGPETPLHYVGRSLIADAAGRMLARAPETGECLITADLSPGTPRAPYLSPRIRDRLLRPTSQEGPAALHNSTMLSRSAASTTRAAAAANLVVRPDDAAPALVRLSVSAGAFDCGGARSAALERGEAAGFAVIRALALEGVQVICVPEAPDDLQTLRARAAENRVFILSDGLFGKAIIAPDGGVLATAGPDQPIQATVNAADADRKRFTPETDMWAGRRPDQYEF